MKRTIDPSLQLTTSLLPFERNVGYDIQWQGRKSSLKITRMIIIKVLSATANRTPSSVDATGDNSGLYWLRVDNARALHELRNSYAPL